MRVLFAASEVYPFAKTGGLADMAAALPKALEHYCSIDTIMPYYSFITTDAKKVQSFSLTLGGKTYACALFQKESLFFLYEKHLCEVQRPYGYKNDYLRFAIFSKAISFLARHYDIIHCNDWHTALVPYYNKRAKVLFTIHNLAYQGIFDASILPEVEIEDFTMEGFEFYGRVNYLKGAIKYSACLTTVSPTYAKEIQTPQFGCGLDGFIKKYAYKLKGILNGIDYTFFDPQTDPFIHYHYDSASFEKKALNKKQFCSLDTPLFIFIGRLVEQKGIDRIIEALPDIAKLPIQLIILGDGDEHIKKILLQKHYSNIRIIIGYDEKLSHTLYAAADFLLMPSRFEPCGLNQMIAARYGTVPIATPVGGLADTVHNDTKCAWGVRIEDGIIQAIEKALQLPRQKVATFDMECDFSIDRCAREYYTLMQLML